MPEQADPPPFGWGCWTVRRTGAVVSVLLLGGCTVGPNFHSPGWANPVSWFSGRGTEPSVPSEPISQPIEVDWWQIFHDPRLTLIERQVAADNLDVQTATMRVAESRSQLGVTTASLYPFVNGNASYEREKASNTGVFSLPTSAPNGASQGTPTATQANGQFGNTAGAVSSANIAPFDIFQYGFDASWELDIWGQVRRQVESSRASLQASEDARRGTLLSALAEVARDYVQLRGYQDQLRIVEENVRTAQQGVNLTRERAAAGVTTDLDVANATAQLNTTASQIPTLQQNIQAEINALSLLLGMPPRALESELATPQPIPPVPRHVPIGFPSEIVRRRPDIREAEAQLHAATADVGVAVAAFYPQVTLSGSFGFQSLQFGELWKWQSRQYGVGPGVTLPIFQGGQLRYTLQLRKAKEREAAVNYVRTVLQAWHDVDNALTAYEREQQRRLQLIGAVAQNRRALALAQARYQQGVSDFLFVLTAEQNLLSTEQQLAISTTTVSTNLVALYLALGGGWQSFYPSDALYRPR